MKNLISILVGLFKKKPVVEKPVTILPEVKQAPKPVISEVKAALVPMTPDATPKKKSSYKPKPKKSNG